MTEIDQRFEVPPVPRQGRDWPRPTSTAYPMKLSDRLADGTTLISGAVGRAKVNQHEHRVVVQWQGDEWVVVRSRLVPMAGPPEGASAAALFEFCRAAQLHPDGVGRVGGGGVAAPQEPVLLEAEGGGGRFDIGPAEVGVDRQLVLGSPGEVVLTLMLDGRVEVAEFAVVWDGPATPVSYRLHADRVTVDAAGLSTRTELVGNAIARLGTRRRRRYRRCRFCKQATPPEWRFEADVCQGCASRELGVVF